MALLSLLGQPEEGLGELRVDEQAVAPVLGVGADHRVEGGQQLLVLLAVPFVAAACLDVGGEPGVVVDGDELVAHGAHRVARPS